MHKENYNINIACFCNKNFNDALIELETFFGFNLILCGNLNELKNKNINAVIFDNENSKKISSLNIKKPKYFLNSKSQSPIKTISIIIDKIEAILKKEKPNAFVIYGDTNSCLSAYVAKD